VCLLGESSALSRLERLDIGANPAGRRGVAAVAAMPCLRWLGLAHAKLTDDDARVLVDREGELAGLDLRGNDLGGRTRAALRERYGDRVALDADEA
jgi:hypothetical protein